MSTKDRVKIYFKPSIWRDCFFFLHFFYIFFIISFFGISFWVFYFTLGFFSIDMVFFLHFSVLFFRHPIRSMAYKKNIQEFFIIFRYCSLKITCFFLSIKIFFVCQWIRYFMTNHHFQFKMMIIFVIHRSVDWIGLDQVKSSNKYFIWILVVMWTK